ncbi:MAG: NAD-dependent epimerase/dehydratase family protein [bacterium]
MKVIVTGGAGFIGSHTVDALVKNKHDVLIIDNLSTGNEEYVNTAAEFIKGDIKDKTLIEKTFVEFRPDALVHLAAQIDVRKSTEDPAFDAEVNILGSLNLYQACIKNRTKKVVFASTGGAIYGDTDNRPTPESAKAKPESPYGIAKLTNEKYLYYYNKVHQLGYVALRYGNVYGPRQNPHGEAGVVAIFSKKLIEKEEAVINGDGKQTRDYVFVSDVVRANVLALEERSEKHIFNVGTGKETDVNKVFNSIKTVLGSMAEEKHGEAKLGEQQTSCLSYTELYETFKWQPEVEFKDGIKQTVDWFKNNLKSA